MRRSNSIPVVLEHKIEIVEEQVLESPVRKLKQPKKPYHIQSQTSSVTEGMCSPHQLQRVNDDGKGGTIGNNGNVIKSWNGSSNPVSSELRSRDVSDNDIVKGYRRGKLCCCDKEKFVHRFTLGTIVLDIFFLIFNFLIYIDLFTDGDFIGLFKVIYKPDAMTDKMGYKVAFNFGMIFIPLQLMLVSKVYTGLKMIGKRFSKSAFMTYYMTSWCFYGSLFTQMTVIITCSWSILTELCRWLGVILVLSFIPTWVFMNIHFRVIRDQNQETI